MPYKVTSLTVEGGKLKPSSKIKEHRDFELIPERLWKALVLWYGGLIALPRQVIRNKEGEVELELNPLSVKLFKHQAVSRPSTAVGGGIPGVIGGYSAAAAANSASVINSSPYYGGSSAASSTSVNAAMPTSTRRYHAFQSAFSRRTTVKQIADFLSSRLHLKHEDVRLWHFRDESNLILLEDEARALEDLGVKDEGSILVEVRSRDGTWPEEITSLCNVENNNRRSSSLFNSSLVASTPGITGLNNLGNTCYLNAAVQCVSNTKILAQYFKRNCHLFELNRTNPLGMKGHVAKRFGDLVRDMWTSDTKTIAPIKLRWTIGRY